jgi:hypothetical protein
MSYQVGIRVILTLGFIALLSACGSSKSGPEQNLNFASQNPISSSKAIATCNKGQGNGWGYRIAAQKLGNSFDPNWAHVFMSAAPAGFEANTSYIQFFKGQATSDTQITYFGTPVQFALFDRQSNTYLASNRLFNSATWNDVKDLIPGSTVASFLSRVIFVLSLQDQTAQYQVISVGTYNLTNNAAVENVQALIPTFFANPVDYSIKSTGAPRETVLRNLHPLRSATSSFEALAQALCQ